MKSVETQSNPSHRVIAIIAAAAIGIALIGLNRFAGTVNDRIESVIETSPKMSINLLKAMTYKHYLLGVDTNRHITLFENGKAIASRTLDYGISAMATDEARQRIYAATSTGELFELDEQIQLVRQTRLPGRITDLKVLADGRVAACYGQSAYGPDYYVVILKDDLSFNPEEQIPTGFCTLFLATNGSDVAYSTVNSRLGIIRPGGKEALVSVLPHQPLALLASNLNGGVIVTADESGYLSLLNKDGQVQWRTKISRYALNLAVLSPDGKMIVTSNRRGTLFVANQKGQVICSSQLNEKTQPYVGSWSDGRVVRVANLIGEVKSVDLEKADQLAWVADFQLFRIIANIVLAILLVAAMFKSSRYASRRLVEFRHQLYRGRTAYFLLLPTFTLLLIFSYYPMTTAVYYSFTKFSLASAAEFVGLDNFRAMISDKYVWIGIRNMFIFLGCNMVKTLTMPLLVAELVYWLGGDRLKQFFRTAFVLPTIVPIVVIDLLWRMIYDPYDGLLNQTLQLLGLSGFQGFAWLATEKTALWSIVFSRFPWIDAFAFLIFLGGLINISKDIYEAAQIDGISTWKRFMHIDLPLIRPQIKLLIVFVFIFSIQDFTNVLIFTGGGPNFSTYVPALHMFYQISEGVNIGYAAAIGLLLFGMVFVATAFHLKMMKTHDL